MIRIGLNQKEKQKIIDDYLSENKIRKVFILYYEHFKEEYNMDCEIEYVEWDDICLLYTSPSPRDRS